MPLAVNVPKLNSFPLNVACPLLFNVKLSPLPVTPASSMVPEFIVTVAAPKLTGSA